MDLWEEIVIVNNKIYKSGYLLILLLVFWSMTVKLVSAEQWLYINPVQPNEVISIETNPDSFGIDDIRFDARFCGNKEKYICVITDGFQFYVPRNLTDKVKEWESNGITYKSRRLDRVKILGLDKPVFHIQRKEGDGVAVFLYSREKGLIGLGGFKANSMGFYILAQSCGFGANKNCNNIK